MDARTWMSSPRRLTVASFAAGIVVLCAFGWSATSRISTRDPSFHVALDMTEGIIALLIAYLLAGRVRARASLSAWICLYALTVLGLTKIAFLGLPTVFVGVRGEAITWAAPATRLVGNIALAVASVVPSGSMVRRLSAGVAAVLAGGTIVVFALVTALASSGDAGTFEPDTTPILVLQALSALSLTVAAVGFTLRAERTYDELFAWFGAGAALGATARVGYVLFPAGSADDVHIQDLLRLGFYGLLLVGAQREVTRYWRNQADAATLEERRRVARDLHDGLAQELVFIAGQARRLGRKQDIPEVAEIVSAADRAVSEARRAIGALTRHGEQSLVEALAEIVEEFSRRYPVEIRLIADPAEDVSAAHREEVLRIVREAMNNAVRHGSARSIAVTLGRSGRMFVQVQDDGTGFDVAGGAMAGGFGLISMRERAVAVGGVLELDSAPGRGTTVTLRLD